MSGAGRALPGRRRRRRAAPGGRIYNGLDLDELRYAPPERRKPLVVGVGRLVEKIPESQSVPESRRLERIQGEAGLYQGQPMPPGSLV